MPDRFEPHRRRLRALAYRMLGSRAQAEDVVQEAWLRWQGAQTVEVDNDGAYLSRVTTHLCLDHLKSARAQREQYVGLWLPEPLIDGEVEAYCDTPEASLSRAQDLSFAMLLALQRLSPLERAAFLLHDVFDLAFDELATVLDRSASACRQLASRARRRMRAQQPADAHQPDRDAGAAHASLLAAFAGAVVQGDLQSLIALLAEDVHLYSDGGGVVCAVPRPLGDPARVAQALIGFAATWAERGGASKPPRAARVNGMPGAVLFDSDGRVEQVFSLDIDATGRVRGVYFQRNPDKLRACA
jgi:RNA polymerase sigma-70 factor (ECF subfamily)